MTAMPWHAPEGLQTIEGPPDHKVKISGIYPGKWRYNSDRYFRGYISFFYRRNFFYDTSKNENMIDIR